MELQYIASRKVISYNLFLECWIYFGQTNRSIADTIKGAASFALLITGNCESVSH